MLIGIHSIALPKRTKLNSVDACALEYIHRIAQYLPTDVLSFRSPAAFFDGLNKHQARTPTHLILLDPRGKLLSSEAFAAHLGRLRDTSTQRVVLAIGPADGWTDAARTRADLLLSLGPMTLPHELARVVLAEQVYRALTILAGHPYHSGH